jgi:hypothetical protein
MVLKYAVVSVLTKLVTDYTRDVLEHLDTYDDLEHLDKRRKMTTCWWELQNEELEDLYSSNNKEKAVPVHKSRAYWVVEIQLHSFLTPEIDGLSGQLYATAALASPPPKFPGTHRRESLVDRTQLNALQEKNPLPEFKPQSFCSEYRRIVTILTTLFWIIH